MQKSWISLGLMSGTSGDGVDASIIRTNGINQYEPIKDKFFEYGSKIYRDFHDLKEKINKIDDLNIYNKEIRFNVLYFDDALCPGDLIMAVKNNYYWLESFSDEGFIANGDILKVSRVYNFEEMYDYSFADIDFYFSDQPTQKMYTCKVNLTTLMLDGPNIPNVEMKKLFLEIEKDNLYIENKKDRKSAVMNSPYFQALQIKFAYALTCHKAQGGQWPTVFLDQGYLPENSINRELLRWMYTSFTRAIDQLYLLNFNPLFIRNEEI